MNQKTGKTTTINTTKIDIQKIIQYKTNVHSINHKLQCTETVNQHPNTTTNLQPVKKNSILNQHLNISQSHTKEHNSISTLFLSTNSPIFINKTNNIRFKGKKNYIIIE